MGAYNVQNEKKLNLAYVKLGKDPISVIDWIEGNHLYLRLVLVGY